MKKVIYFYGPAEVKKHGGLEGLKNYARKNRYQLRDADLYAVEGEVEKADEYKGAVPDHYKEHVDASEGTGEGGDKTAAAGQTTAGQTTASAGSDQTLTDPTA